jgi:hypothetical protein
MKSKYGKPKTESGKMVNRKWRMKYENSLLLNSLYNVLSADKFNI